MALEPHEIISVWRHDPKLNGASFVDVYEIEPYVGLLPQILAKHLNSPVTIKSLTVAIEEWLRYICQEQNCHGANAALRRTTLKRFSVLVQLLQEIIERFDLYKEQLGRSEAQALRDITADLSQEIQHRILDGQLTIGEMIEVCPGLVANSGLPVEPRSVRRRRNQRK